MYSVQFNITEKLKHVIVCYNVRSIIKVYSNCIIEKYLTFSIAHIR